MTILNETQSDIEAPVEGIEYRSLPGKIPNGVFTCIGPRGHRTVKVKTIIAPDKPGLHGKRGVYVMTGPDNTFNYTGVAFLRDDDTLQIWKKMQGTELHKVVNAWRKIFLEGIEGYEIKEARNCIVCNHLLTTPESIESGIGPICARGGS